MVAGVKLYRLALCIMLTFLCSCSNENTLSVRHDGIEFSFKVNGECFGSPPIFYTDGSSDTGLVDDALGEFI